MKGFLLSALKTKKKGGEAVAVGGGEGPTPASAEPSTGASPSLLQLPVSLLSPSAASPPLPTSSAPSPSAPSPFVASAPSSSLSPPSSTSSTPSPQGGGDVLAGKAVQQERKHTKALVEGLCALSSAVLDHSRPVGLEMQHLTQQMESGAGGVRELGGELQLGAQQVQRATAELPSYHKTSEESIRRCSQQVASTADFCVALLSKLQDRQAVYRERVLSSEGRLRSLRRHLNESLSEGWEAQQRRHEAAIDVLLAEFGQPPVRRVTDQRPSQQPPHFHSNPSINTHALTDGEEDTALDEDDAGVGEDDEVEVAEEDEGEGGTRAAVRSAQPVEAL